MTTLPPCNKCNKPTTENQGNPPPLSAKKRAENWMEESDLVKLDYDLPRDAIHQEWTKGVATLAAVIREAEAVAWRAGHLAGQRAMRVAAVDRFRGNYVLQDTMHDLPLADPPPYEGT